MANLKVEISDHIEISGFDSFHLGRTLECGQAFRWDRDGEGYVGVYQGRAYRLLQTDHSLKVWIFGGELDPRPIIEYFCLDKSHSTIEETLRTSDCHMALAVEFSQGLRLVKQEPWECLISYIISARNAIPLIKKTIKCISGDFGDEIPGAPLGLRSFPSPSQLSRAKPADLEKCGVSFRTGYVISAANAVACGDVDLERIGELDYAAAREELMKLRGVGPKIADCVLLFSMQKYESFPIDVWMNRVMRHIYFDGQEVSLNKMQEYARNKFGKLAGYAQEYLFNYARTGIGKTLREADRLCRKKRQPE